MNETFLTGLAIGIGATALVAWIAMRKRDAKARRRLGEVRDSLDSAQMSLKQAALEHTAAEALVESLPAPLYLVDGNLRVLRGNAAGTALIGKDINGRELSDGFRQPDLLATVEQAIELGKSRSMRLELPVPVERAYLVQIEPVNQVAAAEFEESETRGSPAALIMMLDITPVLRTEQLRADFVANVSHELRTPLTSLIGFIETLRGPARDDPEAQERFLGIMQEQADRMYRLISDLLSLSRIEMEEHSVPRGKVDLPLVARKVSDGLAFKLRDRRMQVEIDAPANLPPVAGDEDQLTQVLQNLIDNAIKYGEPDTNVEVRAVTNGNAVEMSVRDHGQGIPREHLPRLTERFYRVDAARSREMGGTGLGLAIVKHIVNRHRGKMTITSKPSDGSTFTVSLPVWRK
ncbi:GHKL domain-containing protein [Hwanghaeella grinnelliae]|uniref:histidine kinase n=1 Tax=Hwanghaeella grinnelliae TaxID=2500179 RepID=A0A437QPE6_9PROT|nr:ATP-binding protein [Hwanghaeella grinnelliae]RVU36317.1 GHKL domain-containing protein [Hwanghaeella grinnelliae]